MLKPIETIYFYFIRQLATVAIIAPDAVSAWRFFEQWQTP
jgi:hypothetical protein